MRDTILAVAFVGLGCAAALAEPRIAELTEGKTVIKQIFVPGRLVNIVVR